MKYGIERVLVLTHSPTTFGVWKNEFRKHCPLDYSIAVQALPDNAASLQVCVLNIQQVYDREGVYDINGEYASWEAIDAKWLIKWAPQAIIVDESTCIGNPMSVQSRRLY